MDEVSNVGDWYRRAEAAFEAACAEGRGVDAQAFFSLMERLHERKERLKDAARMAQYQNALGGR